MAVMPLPGRSQVPCFRVPDTGIVCLLL